MVAQIAQNNVNHSANSVHTTGSNKTDDIDEKYDRAGRVPNITKGFENKNVKRPGPRKIDSDVNSLMSPQCIPRSPNLVSNTKSSNMSENSLNTSLNLNVQNMKLQEKPN